MGCPSPTPGPAACDQGRLLDRVSRVVKAEARPQRDIVSFVRRSARMNPSQERAWRDHRDAYLVEVDRGPCPRRGATGAAGLVRRLRPYSAARRRGRCRERRLLRGDRRGASRPGHRGLRGFEPSIASTVGKLAARGLTNARWCSPTGPGTALGSSRPRPSRPSTRSSPTPGTSRATTSGASSRRRRARSSPTASAGGLFRVATDWEDYALAMREVLDASSLTKHPRRLAPASTSGR